LKLKRVMDIFLLEH